MKEIKKYSDAQYAQWVKTGQITAEEAKMLKLCAEKQITIEEIKKLKK